MKPRISMITVGVEELEKSIAFYDKLGFPRMESPPSVAFFTLNGTWLGLYGREALAIDANVPADNSGFGGFSLSHNLKSERDVDDVMAEAKAAGAVIVKDAQKADWGGYHGYFRDPDGHLWEIACNPFFWVGPEDEAEKKEMSGCGCDIEITDRQQSRVLITLLAINLAMFFIEAGFGLWADSSALIADSLDMLADATVYGIGLYAVGRSDDLKLRAAHMSGRFQILLGLLVLGDALRRFILGSEPEPILIMAIGGIALVANTVCLLLISTHRQGEVHMRASWIFSKNDVIANLGVIAAGLLVYTLGSSLPDLMIGIVIAAVVIRGGITILSDREVKAA